MERRGRKKEKMKRRGVRKRRRIRGKEEEKEEKKKEKRKRRRKTNDEKGSNYVATHLQQEQLLREDFLFSARAIGNICKLHQLGRVDFFNL